MLMVYEKRRPPLIFTNRGLSITLKSKYTTGNLRRYENTLHPNEM